MILSSMVIAIDGPAGSGKGTLARRLAVHFRATHLDSGKLYRLIALRAEDKHVNLDLPRQIEALFRDLSLSDLDNPKLSSHIAGTLAAKYSPQPVIRKYINEFIRRLAREYSNGIVVDGRDIGTIVLPNADVKLFVTADIEERALRRLREIEGVATDATYAQILRDLTQRDRADSNRRVAPLKPAPDGHIVDTTGMDADAVLTAAIAIVESSR